MSCNLVERYLKLKNGTYCDMDIKQTMTVQGVPYLENCEQVTIDLYSENEITPFAKFSYKAKTGYDLFQFRDAYDESNGIFYLILTQAMTSKAKLGVVRAEYNITIPDALRPVTGFNDTYIINLFKFINHVN